MDNIGAETAQHFRKRYVLGFVISEDNKTTLLIKKNSPEWQRGLFNGIGGKMESRESAKEAMVREFKEESGLDSTVGDWNNLGTMEGHDFVVYVYWKTLSQYDKDNFSSPTDETVWLFWNEFPTNVLDSTAVYIEHAKKLRGKAILDMKF